MSCINYKVDPRDIQLFSYLKELGMNYLLDIFEVREIDYRCLRDVTKRDFKKVRIMVKLAELRNTHIEGFPDDESFTDSDIDREETEERAKLVDNIINILFTCDSFPHDYFEKHTYKPKKKIYKEKGLPLLPPSPGIKEIMNIMAILKLSEKGRILLRDYKIDNELNNQQRNALVDIIIDYIKGHKVKLLHVDFYFILRKIFRIFPTEKPYRHHYFIKANFGREMGGELYIKYKNWAKDNVGYTEHDNINPVETPLDCDIFEFWVDAYKKRSKDIQKLPVSYLFTRWPQYKEQYSFLLLEYDFHLSNYSLPNLYSKHFDSFKQKIYYFFKYYINDLGGKRLFYLLKFCETLDSENCIYTLLLLASLPSVQVNKNTNQSFYYNMSDFLEYFSPLVEIIDFVHIQHYKMMYIFEKRTSFKDFKNVPIIFVIGTNYCRISKCVVHFEGIIYHLPNYLACVEFCLHIHRVFKLPYPGMLSLFWEFLQKHFYDIYSESDPINGHVFILDKYLKGI